MPFSRIVVGIDGSPGGEAAARLGGELARVHGSEVFLVHALPLPPIVVGVDQAISEESLEYFETAAETAIGKAGGLLDEMGVAHERIVRPGGAADLLLDVAAEHDADLIVVGHRGLSAMKRFILGSVSSKLAHHARCALLLAPVDSE
jgi:nucleotide-binding universal stress UspA family protein